MKCYARLLASFCLLSSLALLHAQAPAPAPAPAPAKKASCKINTIPPSPAQISMEQGKYAPAADLFTQERGVNPSDSRLHAMQIRNLIAWGKPADASRDATAWATASPTDPYALISAADSTFRSGKLAESFVEAARIQTLDPCNARVYETLGSYEIVIGKLATAKRHIDVAHALDPNDTEITRDWIGLQPNSTRTAARRKFIETNPVFTEERRKTLLATMDKTAAAPRNTNCRLVSGQKQVTIPFVPAMYNADDDPRYAVDISFDGKMRRVELDTGASGITLSAAAAQYLGLKVEDKGRIGGIGDEGSREVSIAYVDHLKFGDLEFAHCEVEILKSSVSAGYSGNIGNGLDGLMGADVFQNFLVTLDYPAAEIRLSQLPQRPGEQPDAQTALDTSTSSDPALHEHEPDKPLLDAWQDPSMEKWTPFYRFGHDIVVPTQLSGGPVKLMIADTGAHLDIITPEAAREVTTVATTAQISIYGISGRSAQAYLTGKITLHFGGLYLPLDWMAAQDNKLISESDGTEISGFIGFPTLRQMTFEIDYRDRLIHFDYDPKRKYNPKFQPRCYVGETNCKHFGS